MQLLAALLAVGLLPVRLLLTEVAAGTADPLPNPNDSEDDKLLLATRSMIYASSVSCPQPTRRSTFVVLVDALRPAMLWNPRLFPLLGARWLPRATVSAAARAGVPTVTWPRLRALLSGQEGSFLDIAWNVLPRSSVDSTIVDIAAKDGGRRVAFYGDETWLRVVKASSFARYGVVESFDVHDTENIDATVDEWLRAELSNGLFGRRNDLDVLIAHFLGVDHVGHTSHPDSVMMTEKLIRTDRMLNKLFDSACSAADRDVTVVLLSDHGMAVSGGHGGGSDAERLTVLEVIVCSRLNVSGQTAALHATSEWSQTDVTVLLAALLHGGVTSIGRPRQLLPSTSRGVLREPMGLFDGCSADADAAWTAALNYAHLQGASSMFRLFEAYNRDLRGSLDLHLRELAERLTAASISTISLTRGPFEVQPLLLSLSFVVAAFVFAGCMAMLLRPVALPCAVQAVLMGSTSYMEEPHVAAMATLSMVLAPHLLLSRRPEDGVGLAYRCFLLLVARVLCGGALFPCGDKWRSSALLPEGAALPRALALAHPLLTACSLALVAAATCCRTRRGPRLHSAAIAVLCVFVVPGTVQHVAVAALLVWWVAALKVPASAPLEIALLDAAQHVFGGSLRVADVEFTHVVVPHPTVTGTLAILWRFFPLFIVLLLRCPSAEVLHQWCLKRLAVLCGACLVAFVLRGHLFYWSVVLPTVLQLSMTAVFSAGVSLVTVQLTAAQKWAATL
jgi:hypothetical protein